MQSQRRYPVPMLDVRSALVQAVREALDALGAAVDVVVEPSARAEFGDWSTPAPLAAARVLRRAPLQIAEELRDRLQAAPLEVVEFLERHPAWLRQRAPARPRVGS